MKGFRVKHLKCGNCGEPATHPMQSCEDCFDAVMEHMAEEYERSLKEVSA
jgi:hypothetical protein